MEKFIVLFFPVMQVVLSSLMFMCMLMLFVSHGITGKIPNLSVGVLFFALVVITCWLCKMSWVELLNEIKR